MIYKYTASFGLDILGNTKKGHVEADSFDDAVSRSRQLAQEYATDIASPDHWRLRSVEETDIRIETPE
jgi:hypothetical protein